jgi:hypothetical protein
MERCDDGQWAFLEKGTSCRIELKVAAETSKLYTEYVIIDDQIRF